MRSLTSDTGSVYSSIGIGVAMRRDSTALGGRRRKWGYLSHPRTSTVDAYVPVSYTSVCTLNASLDSNLEALLSLQKAPSTKPLHRRGLHTLWHHQTPVRTPFPMSCPPAQASPTHARVAAVRILAPASSGTVLTSESAFRTEYRIDLLRAVLYDREDVLGNLLGNHSLDDDMLIDSIAFAMEKNCSDELREIARMSASISHDEKAMCKPLVRRLLRSTTSVTDCQDDLQKKIFARIEAAMVTYKRGGTRAFFRQTIAKDDERVRLEDPLFPEAFYGRPDFLVADVPSRASHRDHNLLTDLYPSQELLRWRQCPAFIEVKASSAQSPTGAPKGDSAYAKETLVQGADYARMILASRPFQMHAYGVFICGSQLTVGLFDRSGISLSPNMDITKPTGLRTLVHIMVRMLWEMSPVDLGLDPTVELLPGETFCQPEFPRFRVAVNDVSGSTSCVETVGQPLWVSYSLLGRGTSVWSALTADHVPVILKTAWHTPGRIPEAEIYKKIAGLLKGAGKPYPRGIARMITGGDVSHDGAPVAVARLRDLSTGTDPPFPHDHNIVDRILHRVVLEDYGKPLWEWAGIKELGLALLDVVEGTKLLSRTCVVH